jgi:agmatinase
MTFDPDAAARPDSGIYGLDSTPADARVVLVPVPFEATVSYGGGTAGGPAAILAASRQVDLFDLETGRPYAQGICLLPGAAEVRAWSEQGKALAAPVIEAGGAGDDPALRAAVAKVDALGDQVNAWLAAQVEPLLDQGKLVGVLGGDHSVPFASIAAHARRHPGLGVLHVDAHADLRRAYEGFRWSHASIFWNVLEQVPEVGRLVGVGYRDVSEQEHRLIDTDPRCEAFPDPWLRRRLHDGAPWSEVVAEVVSRLPQDVYVSFDIDGLDPVLCPSTGTPVPGGLSFPEATALFRGIVESGRRIVGFDLCEVAPDPTGRSEWDGNVAARLLYKLIGFALRSARA